MKKIVILMLIFICLFSCNFGGENGNTNNNNGSREEITDYTTAEKLAGKTFSYFTQDVEAGDEAVLFKKSIGFGEIDKDSNTIALEIKDFKGNESNGVYDIRTNSIEGKVLDVSGLDATREFDKEFTLDGLAFENCGQKMKWAKLLEGNTYGYTTFDISYTTFKTINNGKIELDKHTVLTDLFFYEIEEARQVQKTTENADPTYTPITKITKSSFVLGNNNDGNGACVFNIVKD